MLAEQEVKERNEILDRERNEIFENTIQNILDELAKIMKEAGNLEELPLDKAKNIKFGQDGPYSFEITSPKNHYGIADFRFRAGISFSDENQVIVATIYNIKIPPEYQFKPNRPIQFNFGKKIISAWYKEFIKYKDRNLMFKAEQFTSSLSKNWWTSRGYSFPDSQLSIQYMYILGQNIDLDQTDGYYKSSYEINHN